jgi:glycosyltransferase involved in cell wall biosynthesis
MEAFARLPVTLLTEPHCGHPGRVRNTGLKQVKTTHVAFLDSDDVWARSKIKIQVDAARQGVRAQGSAYQVDTNQLDALGGSIEISFVRLSLRDLLKQNQLCNSSVLIEVSLLREIGGLATSYAVRGIEDYATWLRVATRTAWSFSPTPLVTYSDFPATSMRATNEFSVSERTLALWDLAWWLRSQGKTVPKVAKLGMRGADFVLRSWAARQGPNI